MSERGSETRIAATVDALVAASGEVEGAIELLADSNDPAVLADVAQILGRRNARSSVSTLATLVEHVDDNVAVAAIEALGRIGGRGAVDVLVQAVQSPRFFRSFAAIDVLGRSGDPRAVAPLVALLDNVNTGGEAMRALGRTGDRAAVNALSGRLIAPSDGVVRAAALALVDLRQKYGERLGTTLPVEETLRAATPSAAVRRLIHCINHADSAEQLAIIVILGCLQDEAAVPALLRALDANPGVATVAAETLKRLNTHSDTELLESLRSGNSARREALLPIISRGHAAEAVLDCLSDTSPVVRRLACEAIARIGNSDVVARLFKHLKDRSPAVVQAAIAAINALGSAHTYALAVAASVDPDAGVRRAAFRILAYGGGPETLPTLQVGTRDSDARVREAAIQGLSLVESDDALELLLSLANDPAPTTRSHAVRALGTTDGGQGVVDQLLRALSDADAWVRYYACQALGKLRAVPAAQAVAGLLGDPAGQVRIAAIEALSHLGGELAFRALERATQSDDVDQVRSALVGLGISNKSEAIPLLRRHVTAPDVATRLLAISALAKFETQESLEVLKLSTHDEEESIRAAAIGFLGQRDSVDATLALVALLNAQATSELALAALTQHQPQRVAGISLALQSADDDLALQLTHVLARLKQPDATVALYQAVGTHV